MLKEMSWRQMPWVQCCAQVSPLTQIFTSVEVKFLSDK